MLNLFKPTNLHAFKTGYVTNEATEEQKVQFKYRRMTDKEIDELQFAQGLDSGRTTMNIATFDTVYFDTKSLIDINGWSWAVIQKKETEKNGIGMFRSNSQKITYLTIQTGAEYDRRVFTQTN